VEKEVKKRADWEKSIQELKICSGRVPFKKKKKKEEEKDDDDDDDDDNSRNGKLCCSIMNSEAPDVMVKLLTLMVCVQT
jgi:hypothetical protein